MPDDPEVWSFQPEVLESLGYKELGTRLEAAQRAAQEMDRWSGDYAESLRLILGILLLAKERSEELLEYQVIKARPQMMDSEDLPMMDYWSTTQSTTGIMTPTEDWSDLGSDTTERGHTPAITRHSLQLCGYATANFLRLVVELHETMSQSDTEAVKRLHEAYNELVTKLLHSLDAPVPLQYHGPVSSSAQRVTTKADMKLKLVILETSAFLRKNNDIEESFGHLPGSTPVSKTDMEAMHRDYSCLVQRLRFALAAPIPFQEDQLATASASALAPAPARVLIPAPEVPRPVVPDVQSEACIDETLEAIIGSMESEPTEKDIMKLVFHWTTLEECNGWRRAEIMQLK